MNRTDTLRLMIIDDSREDIDYLQELCGSWSDGSTEFCHAENSTVGLARLDSETVDLLLLDLGLPESRGLDTVLRFREVIERIPVIVLTGLDDEAVAVRALQIGVQDYLIKGEFDQRVLFRSMRYALERHRLVSELSRVSGPDTGREYDGSRQGREASFPNMATVAGLFGSKPLSKSAPEKFEELAGQYGKILDHMLEVQLLKKRDESQERLSELADELGFLKSGPQDVVDIHGLALQKRLDKQNYKKSRAYLDEGRIQILGLMGHLVSYYRKRVVL